MDGLSLLCHGFLLLFILSDWLCRQDLQSVSWEKEELPKCDRVRERSEITVKGTMGRRGEGAPHSDGRTPHGFVGECRMGI